MSGDVQPRKRKDKKRKKDELGVEEPRGTAAALGEGDVFMHSHHEHATGGHWCAKIIFFSLLAILVTLIGLIILENRGLSDLEANSVESRYSGVLEGWLEDAPDDDHHDEHTLELTHHDDEDDHDEEIDNANDDDHQNEGDASDESEHSDEDFDHDEALEDNHELSDEDGDEENNGDDDDEENNMDDDDEDNQSDNGYDSQEQEKNYEDDDEELEREDDEETYEADEVAENDDLQEIEENDHTDNTDEDDENEVYDAEGDEDNSEIDRNESEENDENENQSDNEDVEEHEEEEEDNEEVEVEKLERENSEEEDEPISAELPALPEDDDDDDNEDHSDGKDSEADEDSGSDDEEFLEMDDPDEPPVERITVPAGKPFVEVEEEISSEQPPDTLEEEEEYEKRQEELRREEAQASHMWLKLSVGAALLVATHAVLRRATHSRDAPESEEHASREETPVVDRRMTLIAEEPHVPARRFETVSRPIVMEQVIEKMVPIVKSIPIRKQESEEEEEEKDISEDEDEEVIIERPDERELYSEDEADEEIEEEEEEEIVVAKKESPKLSAPVVTKKPEPEPVEEIEDDPDVEIIGDEQLEEELEEEEDEEEISDVDDVELLTRLEAKYGRLADPERAGPTHKDGGNSVDDLWPGEPSDAYWREQLDSAEQEIRQGSWSAAEARAAAPGLRGSARARYVLARSLDLQAEAKRDNRILTRAIQAYLELLKMNERLSDKKLLEITGRTLDRIQFRGNYLSAEPVYRLLIRRFPNEPAYRNNLTISFLMANRVDLAEEALKETLKRWPKDRVALAHYGFVLKTKHNKYEEAAAAFREALEGDTGPANEARFYYHYGDSLLLLGRKEEAHEVHKRGAKLGHFLSPNQRSLYNVPRLKSSPWWDVEKTPYVKLARALESSWREILKEGEAAKALYEQEKEGLKERGEWSQMDLFVRGREVPGRCERARVTCGVLRAEPAATTCRRGQVKFSLMSAGTHVRAHVGPTNCRLRMHLGLSNTKDTYIRVDQEIRQWQEGKVLMFDDSFEHEVWHNGSGARLVLIADVWHPGLSAAERAQLPAI